MCCAVVLFKNLIALFEPLAVPLLCHPAHEIFGHISMYILCTFRLFRYANYPVHIRTELVLGIIRHGDRTSHVNRLMTNIHSITERFPVKRGRHFVATVTQYLASFVDEFCLAVTDISSSAGTDHMLQGIGIKQLISSIEKQHIIARCFR